MRRAFVLIGFALTGCSVVVTQQSTPPDPHPSGSMGVRSESTFDRKAGQTVDPNAPKTVQEVLKSRQNSAQALSGGMKDVDSVLGGKH